MSSLVERLRTRTERKRLYAEDDSEDDDLFTEPVRRSGSASAPQKTERFSRADAVSFAVRPRFEYLYVLKL